MAVLAFLKASLGWDIPRTAVVLGSLCYLATVAMTYGLSYRLSGRDQHTSLIAALLIGACGEFAVYGPSGMETPLFVFLFLAVIFSTLSRRWFCAGMIAGLATMTRPDGVLLLPAILGWAACCRFSKGKTVRSGAATLSGFCLLIVPWTLWRVSYYGYLLPNAVKAKSGGNMVLQLRMGINYVCTFVFAHSPLLWLIVLMLAIGLSQGLRSYLRKFRAVDWWLLAIITTFSLFVLMVGGDWMPAHRFLVPILPPLCILLSRLWCEEMRSFPALSVRSRGVRRTCFRGLAALSRFIRDNAAAAPGLARSGGWIGGDRHMV